MNAKFQCNLQHGKIVLAVLCSPFSSAIVLTSKVTPAWAFTAGPGRGFWSVWSNYVLSLFLKTCGGAFPLRTQLLSICIDQEKKRKGFATRARTQIRTHRHNNKKRGGGLRHSRSTEKKTIRFLWSVPLPGIFLPTSKDPRSTPVLAAPALREPSPRPCPGLDLPRRTRRGFFFLVAIIVVACGAGLLSSFSDTSGRDATRHG